MESFLWGEHEQDFWGTHLDEAFSGCLSPKGEFLKMPEASLEWVKKPDRESGKGNFSV